LIVIDGGSTDGTKDVIQKNAQRITYWVSEPDRGVYNAWNKALVQAKGEWICFLGSDDYLWDELAMERMAEQLVLIPSEVRVAYGQIMLLDRDDLELFTLGRPWSELKMRFKAEMCIPHPAVMHRRSLFEVHGIFDDTYRIVGDYALLLHELKDGQALFVPDVIVTAMRQGGISSKPKNTLRALRELRQAQKQVGLNWPGHVWALAVARVYIRTVLWKVLGEKHTRVLLDVSRRLMGLPVYWTKT
jgi:glycosyltransferase involved in cell wall biosynthesis